MEHWNALTKIAEVAALVVLSLLWLVVIVRRVELHMWNNGYCPRCGEAWTSFDGDPRGYNCALGHYIWIGWLTRKERCQAIPDRLRHTLDD